MYHSRPARKVRAYRPRLEVLESRNLLSTYLVDHLADDGVGTGLTGSLRYAITQAVDGDAINFGVNGTINLTGALPNLTHNISINGPGANLLTVRRDTGGDYRIFTVFATDAISGLTIANGSVGGFDYGGGISNNGGSLTLSNCTVSGNLAGSRRGGGIYNGYEATLTISNSTIARNESFSWVGSSLGGGIYNEDGATLTMSNSTIAANVADVGGIYNGIDAMLTISNSTISNNIAGYYGTGGIANTFGTLNLRNSIVAGNDPNHLYAYDLSGDLTSSGYNLIGYGGSGFAPTDIVGVDRPRLGPLQNNGGPTQTMAPLAGSSALNAGDPAQLGVPDQRGVVRSGGVNIGAYQASASAFVLTAPDTVTTGMPFDVTVKAVDMFGQTALGYTGTVTFSTTDPDPGVVLPAAYTFTAGDQGTHTFSSGFTLMTPGAWVLTASDLTGGFSASLTLTVTP
jgi:hypothetical protein